MSMQKMRSNAIFALFIQIHFTKDIAMLDSMTVYQIQISVETYNSY